MLNEPLFIFLAALAILISGISKGGFGGGLGVIAVPLLSMAVSPVVAAAIMLPILCSMDLMGLKTYWGTWDNRLIKILLPAAILGIVIGTLSFNYLSASDVKLMIGIIAVGFALYHWLKPFINRQITQHSVSTPSRLWGGFWGTIAGFTSFVSHAGGPPVGVYLLPMKLDKTIYQGTTILFFTVVNYIKLIPYTLLGQFNSDNLFISLVFIPWAFVSMKLGAYLHHRVSDVLFYRLAYIMLFMTGCKLIWDGL